MKAEKSIRRIGLIFLSLAFLIQFFAFISPPQPTQAASPNDLINGGFSSAAEAANDCRSNLEGYGSILATYGITCDRVAAGNTITINSRDWNGQLYSMGRDSYGNVAGNTPVNAGGTTLFARYLWGWDSPGTSSTYQALNVTSPGGQTFLLLYPCGNVTSVGFPQSVPPPAPPPTPVPAPAPPPKVCALDTAILASNSWCVPCLTNPQVIWTSSQCKPCKQSSSSQDIAACIVRHKTASNLTQGIADANGTTAQAGDLIKYTLYAQNSGAAVMKDFIFSDDLNYVLDYSTVSDAGGGTVDSKNTISWPPQTIQPKQTASVSFQVRVDDPIPQTPTSSSDPNFFNLVMSNTYYNTIKINLPASPAKVVEAATTTSLPNTGPGTSILFAAILVAAAGFFYYRSRLLVDESAIAIKESVEGGL
ncbi:MAG TPA: isopeptide-forming domain-containing fimbrial protein [Candidatus Saccharimonadales bacterium]